MGEKEFIYNPLTYSSEFFIPVQISDEISKKIYLKWLLLVDMLIQTKRGHFIVNGYPKTVVHQITRSPGIRFKNEENQILADIISVRGAWMGIKIQYEKSPLFRTLQMNRTLTPISNRGPESFYSSFLFKSKMKFSFKPLEEEQLAKKEKRLKKLKPRLRNYFKNWQSVALIELLKSIYEELNNPLRQPPGARRYVWRPPTKYNSFPTTRFAKQKFELRGPHLQSGPQGLNKQINETLFVLFYSSPPRHKEQKNQIKISGFSFLHYLFDNPFFHYRPYIPSYKSLRAPVMPRRSVPVKHIDINNVSKHENYNYHPPRESTRSPKNGKPFSGDQVDKTKWINKSMSYFLYSKMANKGKHIVKKNVCGPRTGAPIKSFDFKTPRGQTSDRDLFQSSIEYDISRGGQLSGAPRHSGGPEGFVVRLINTLNTNNFRDILFERFFNPKFYDIGLMGRKRLNKKLRLNIPLHCTALTPLDFLALFYKLFFLLNPKTPFNSVSHFLPDQTFAESKSGLVPAENRRKLEKSLTLQTSSEDESPCNYEPVSLISPLNNLREQNNSLALRALNVNYESHPQETMKTFPGLMANWTQTPTINQNLSKDKVMLKKSLLGESIQRSSLDHLNQRHIRTSGEFLFLQFWRSVLRFYQILSQLSNRSNFLGPRPYVSNNFLAIS